MSDAVIMSIVTSIPVLLVSVGTFWNVVRVHKSVNSTALALAEVAKAKEVELGKLKDEVATLKENLRGRDTIAAIVAASARSPEPEGPK